MKAKFNVLLLALGLMEMAVVASSLPDGYEELAYVESTGEQYVDSGYKVKARDTVKAVMELRRDQPGVEATAFGAQPVEPPWNNACLMDVRMGGTGHYRVWRGKGKNVYCDKPGFYGVKIAVEIDGAGFRWKPAGAAAWAEELACASTGDCAQSLYVCATHLAACDHVCPDRFAALKLYSLEITSADGTPQRTFVPCRRVRDGEAGLFDTVERRFHANLGPSPFVLPAGTRPANEPVAVAKSPDGKNEIRLWANPLAYEVRRAGAVLVGRTEISLKVDGRRLGLVETPQRTQTRALSGTVPMPIYKKSFIDLVANETEADFGGWGVRLIARNDGVAYRFETNFGGEMRVEGEEAGVTIPDAKATCIYTPETRYGFEEAVPQTGLAETLPLATGEKGKVHFYLPFVYSCAGHTVAVVDSDGRDYPVWNLRRRAGEEGKGVSLRADFAPWPHFISYTSLRAEIKKTAPYLVRTEGTRTFPWRGFILADSPVQLCEADLIDALARPATGDFSWVKPGKVIWDWWCFFDNLGVAKGCTTETYRRYIDFAAKHGIEYVYLDGVCDVGRTVFWDKAPKFDIPALAEYGQKKGVGVFVWLPVSWFKGNEADLVDWAADIGLKGFKIDFLDRGDADMERFVWRFAELCAKRKLLVDYHGAHRPAGLCRTYPNILSFEGVFGLENTRWFRGGYDFMANDLGLFYTRLVAGTMDYTPGSMDNYPLGKHKNIVNHPGSQGTRVHQMALVMMFQAYIQMLAESITKYERNMECFKFMAQIPVVWDDTVALGGTPTTYAAMARRTGDVWYAAAIGNAQKQEIAFETAFLGKGEWMAEIFSDAADAATAPTHYVHRVQKVKAGEKMAFTLALGGGCIVRFTRAR